jgi:hypothetical protein
VELALDAKPLRGLTIGAWVAWEDAALTKGLPAASGAYGISGDTLPYSTRFSGNISLKQEFPLWSNVTGFVGGVVSYVGAREGNFQSAPQRQRFPPYGKTNLRAGMRLESWTVNLFVDNVADRRGIQGGGLDNIFPPNAFIYIQPRTVGISVSKEF